MIESSGNNQIKNITKLLKSRSERKKQGSYIVEGPKMVLEAARFGTANKIYIEESMWKVLKGCDSAFSLCNSMADNNRLAGMNSADALEILTSCDYEIVSDNVFDNMSDTVTPQGVLAIVSMRDDSIDTIMDVSGVRRRRYIILENIQDPGNLGTILRTAEAAGFDAVIMNKGTVDIYNPKVVRSTMGAVLRIPFAYEEDINSIITKCRERHITVTGAALTGEDIRNVIYPEQMAIIIGNESRGLSEETLNMCDQLIKIPMHGQAESLNASVAAGILMYLSIL